MFYLGTVIPFLYNYFGTDDDVPKLDPIPFTIVLCLTFIRFFIISVRHGITPANFMLRLTEEPITTEEVYEQLLGLAWVIV